MASSISGLSLPAAGQMANELVKSQNLPVTNAATHSYHLTAEQMKARTMKKAQDFETVFVNNMFQHMYTGIDGEGPFGGAGGAGVWRTFLTNEFAKNFVKAGGIGITKQVYNTLLAHQEAHP